MTSHQAGILQAIPAQARYMSWTLPPAGADLRAALRRLAAFADGSAVVVGLGPGLVAALGEDVPGLHEIPPLGQAVQSTPVTPQALWCWLRAAGQADRGDLVHLTRRIEQAVQPALRLPVVVDAFRHHEGRDLTGYEDGTENPQGDEAAAAALVRGAGPGLDGSSFVSVQQWVHNFDSFEAMQPPERDHSIGRRLSDNEELDDAPPSAHVKRTAQESFTPEAFSLRRSMPWAQDGRAGLMFVSFGHSLHAFEAQLRRMTGAEDGIADALFRFTRPVTGANFWCPPMRDGRIDLSAVGV